MGRKPSNRTVPPTFDASLLIAADRAFLLNLAKLKVPEADAEDVVQSALIRAMTYYEPSKGAFFTYTRFCLNTSIAEYWRAHRPTEMLDWHIPGDPIRDDGVWYDQLYKAVAERCPEAAEIMDDRLLERKCPPGSSTYSRRWAKLRAILAELGFAPRGELVSAAPPR